MSLYVLIMLVAV